MKTKIYRKLAPLLLLASTPLLIGSTRTLPPEGLDITTMVDKSDLVFLGKVTNVQFVYRRNIWPQYTTDVTVKVEEKIKGKPNYGKNWVKFMLPGGAHDNHRTRKKAGGLWISGTPGFKRGERLLMFMRIDPYSERPYRGLALVDGWWGKCKIVDEKSVSVWYTTKKRKLRNGTWNEAGLVRPILLPVDLAVKIARAASKDAYSTLEIEERIRTFAQQTPIKPSERPYPDQELLDSVESEIDKILIRMNTEKN
ncbi:MAG: hypothetical protein OXP71_10530 [Candidatus Poribacteria bacterium]|nr:hypothetical protein [Candidatus Poribacteria bacterium]